MGIGAETHLNYAATLLIYIGRFNWKTHFY